MVRNKGIQKQQTRTKNTQSLASLQKEKNTDKQSVKNIKDFFEHRYKILLWIPFIMLFLALAQLGFQEITTGSFINKGISLKGGVTITINEVMDLTAVNDVIIQNTNSEFSTRYIRSAGVITGLIIELDIPIEQVDILRQNIQTQLSLSEDDFNVEIIGSSLGESFFKEIIFAILLSFLFMGIVVFLYFRIVIPSIAIILAAASNILVTMAITNVAGIELSTAGIAAFLMIIGYSVDTDILLSTRVLKEKRGTVFERILNAAKPGLTMSITTLGAVTIALIFSTSDVLKQIMTIIFIGLLVDLINTWIQNAGIIRLYMEKRGEK